MKNYALSFNLILLDIMKGRYVMKKFLIMLGVFVFASPAFAVCSLNGGGCSVSLSNWESKPLQQKLVPNNLQDMQRTDAFQPNYFKPYHDALINTKEDSGPAPASNYNSNCQFGVCLPGESTPAGPDNFE